MKTVSHQPSFQRVLIAAIAIFVVALGVRLLSWHDTRREVRRVQTVVAADYQHAAKLLGEGGVRGFFSKTGPLADPNLLGHPPGYPVLIALVWSVSAESDISIQIVQIVFDALAAVLIFLIAVELFPVAVGIIAGLLVALAPQFSWNSVLLLPDTLAVFPLILAVYFLARAVKNPRLVTVIMAGACVGASCWLRANALLMAPFLAITVLLLFDQKWRLRFAAIFLAAAIVVIAPLTIRNWIVFHHFIPVSLGAGQTMLEGIADYDPERRFGIPNTDMGIMKMEAEEHNRPDYYSTLFVPDGITRDRQRVAKAFAVIRQNPGWYFGVMIQRAGSMLRLERARRISLEPPVKHYAELNESQRVWQAAPNDLNTAMTERSPDAQFEVSSDGQRLQINTDAGKFVPVLSDTPITIRKNHEYVLRMPAVVTEGRLIVSVVGEQSNKEYASGIVEKLEVKNGLPPPAQTIELPFVSGKDEPVRVAIHNAAADSESSAATLGTVEMFHLGPASYTWTRYLRLVITGLQRLFITAVMLPLALAGVFILIWRRAFKTLLLLSSVPVYYLCFQSLLHTEYRYVLAIHYFLFIIVAVTLYEVSRLIVNLVSLHSNKPVAN